MASFFSNRRQIDPPVESSGAPPRVPAPQLVSAQSPIGFETVLGSGSVMEGHFKSSGNVRLDGTFTGTLEISGSVLVGETAKITADIHAKNVSIAGAVRGNVSGKKVQLLRTGRIWGDINAAALTTEEGAFIDGKITMIAPDVSADPLSALIPPVDTSQAISQTPSTAADHPTDGDESADG